MNRHRLPLMLSAALALCSIGGAVPAVAQTTEGDCVEECAPAAQAPVVDTQNFETAPYTDILRRGQPFLCGNAADTARKQPDVDCRIDARLTIPAKAAHYLGLRSRVLADGVADGRTDHYKPDRSDEGRAYFLELPAAVKAKLRAKHVRGLGVTITGKVTVKGADQVYCDDGSDRPTLHAGCSLDSGRKANIWGAQDGEIVCWTVMPWWVAIRTSWGKMCPRPINA